MSRFTALRVTVSLACLEALLIGVSCAAEMTAKRDDEVVVKVVGTLKSGLIAIGGETTGAAIQSKGALWELDLSSDTQLKRSAEQLNGKRVSVVGRLKRKSGVEVPDRWIVTVTRLTELPK